MITGGGGHTYPYHREFAAQQPPRREMLETSVLAAGREWNLDNFLFDLRSAGNAAAVSTPTEKRWTSNMSAA